MVKDEVFETLKRAHFMIDGSITKEIELVLPKSSPPVPRCYWWFAIRGDEIHPFFETHWRDCVDCIWKFLSIKKFAPSLCFICTDNHFTTLSWFTPRNYPAIILNQRSFRISRHSERKLHEAVSTFVNQPRLFESLLHERGEQRSAFKLFQSLLVNPYTHNQKIVVTDWDDPSTPKPDLQCSEYPVKAFIYFIGEMRTRVRQLKNFVKNTSFHTTCAEVVGSSLLTYYDPNTGYTSSSEAISIAFAGKAVQSAVYKLNVKFLDTSPPPLTKIQCEVSEFRDNLPFPIDDGLVTGFLFEYLDGWNDHTNSVSDRILGLFPSIELIRIRCRPSKRRSNFCVHLIRI